MNQFTVYKNYYYLIQTLKEEEKQILSLAIFEYMFEDIEPNFEEKTNLFYVWENIKMPLNTSKKQGSNRKKPKENQKKTKKKPKENQKESNKNTFLFLISNISYFKDRGLLRGKIEEWIEYKKQRKEKYTEKGFNSLLKQIQNNCEKYGEENVTNLIDECMANNYKGIIFEKLEKKQNKKETQSEKLQREIKEAEEEERRMKID